MKYTVLLKLFTLPFKALSKVRLTKCSLFLLQFRSTKRTLCLAGWDILPSSQRKESISCQDSPACHCRPLHNTRPPPHHPVILLYHNSSPAPTEWSSPWLPHILVCVVISLMEVRIYE